MTDRENLPAVINQQVVVHSGQRGSLVMRGLVAIQESKGLAQTKDNDALYREARTIFNEWSDKGNHLRKGSWNEIKDPDLFVVFKKFQQLANKNYGKAYFPLSVLFHMVSIDDENGKNRAQYFAQLAIEWCLINQANQDVELWCDLGNIYRNGRGGAEDTARAAYWYRKAAEQGYAYAQGILGFMYSSGEGVPEDEKQALEWYRKAADQGDGHAQINLGFNYARGEGVLQDYKQAIEWYLKSAEQGYVHAQYALGQMYERGQGVPQDYKIAAEWYRKTAEQGYASALNELGEMYRLGRGCEQDAKKAVEWYRKAVEQRDYKARQYLESRGIDWRKRDAS